jgi:hypothetical protein
MYAGALLSDETIRQSAAQPVIHARLGDSKRPSQHKMHEYIVTAFLEDRFGGKDGTHNQPAEEVRRLAIFLY